MGTGKTENPWEADYRRKGRLYGGSSRSLPVFPDGTRVLEIGCGDGKTLSHLAKDNRDVTAVDFSPRAVSLAQEAVGKGTGVTCVVANAMNLPFRTGTFDVVTAIHVIGHSDSAGRFRIAREILRVLRPGGLACFAGFSVRDFRCGSGKETEPGTWLKGNGIATHYFTEQEVRDLFSGFVAGPLKTEEWTLRVRGKDHSRSEITACFTKARSSPGCMDHF